LADGKRCPLEDRLHEIVKAILDDAEQSRLNKIESERREVEAAIERKRREEEDRLRRIEEARRFDLWSRVEDFTLICRAKDYLQSVEGWARATGVDLQPESEMSHWLEWARSYVNQQERVAVETVLKKQRGPEPEAPRRHWDPDPKPPKAWGYWARTYKGW
jgi:predicted AAA+ superfamily ATPase